SPESIICTTITSSSSSLYNIAPSPQSTLYNAVPPPQSTFYNAAPTSQQEYHCLYPSQPQSQTLLPNECDLILSLRMMQNLSVLPTFQPLSSPAYPHTSATTSTTALQQLYPQQITYATAQLQQLSTTSAPSPLRISVPPVLTQTRSSSPHSGHRNQSPVPQLQILSSPLHSGHLNQSSVPQLQSYSPPPVSPPSVIVSPVQQQQKSPNQILSVSSQQHQSTNPQRPTFVQHNPLITEPTIQLCDPTKPYEIGDKIKVGGRTLQSDRSSIKYWVEDDITITQTASGGHILNMTGYSYYRKNYGKNFTTWECEHRRYRQCSAVVIRSSDPNVKNNFRIYSIQGEHTHEPAPDNIEVRKFKQRARERCKTELANPRTIYEDELKKGKYSREMLAVIPTFYNMQAQLYRIRQEHLPPSPSDSNFILHPGFTCTNKGERFLLYDSDSVQVPCSSAPPKVGRLLIYSSNLQLNLLSKSKRVGSDGTFETAAQISQQNYIIMSEFEEIHTVPLVYCLCEKKNYETYKLIIQILRTAVDDLQLNFEPMFWMSDYESGLIKAIKQELPNTKLLGCTFHYNQAIYRNIQLKGLQDAYQNIEVVRQILRQTMALAFIPNDQIKTVYYDVIKPQLNNVSRKPTSLRHNLDNFFTYYESQWLTKTYKFCVFGEPIRTNNGLEGYNNKMSAQLSSHPHLYRLILWFEKEELLVQQLLMKVISDKPVHKRKRAAITTLIDYSLQSLWNSYNAGTLNVTELLLGSSKWIAKKAS
ncbi:unnamed protein product, partial [Rotaria sordida]